YLNLSNDVGQRIAREAFITYGVDPLALDQLDPETDIAALDVLLEDLAGTQAHVTVSHWAEGKINVRVDGAQLPVPGDIAPAPAAKKPNMVDRFAAAAAQRHGNDTIPF